MHGCMGVQMHVVTQVLKLSVTNIDLASREEALYLEALL